jgi:hypothetical protein
VTSSPDSPASEHANRTAQKLGPALGLI